MFLIEPAYGGDEVCIVYAASGDSVSVEDIPGVQSSGVAAARGLDNAYYTHDDAGGDAKLYMFRGDDDDDRLGEYIGEQNLVGATNTDWEDMAAGPCPDTVDSEHCLWIADIGDNDKTRTSIVLWVVPESTRGAESAVGCNLVYPGGDPHDAEAILVGPDGTVRIVTKSSDGTATVYRISDPACDDGTAQTLEKEAEVALDESVTGGAMSADGTAVVLRTLSGAWLWTGCTIAWSSTPTAIDLGAQPQGESVAFDSDGSLVTTSEGDPLRVWSTPCADATPLTCPEPCGCGGGAGLLFVAPFGVWARRRRRKG